MLIEISINGTPEVEWTLNGNNTRARRPERRKREVEHDVRDSLSTDSSIRANATLS